MILIIKLMGTLTLLVSMSAYGFYMASKVEVATKRILEYIACITELRDRISYNGGELLNIVKSAFGDLPIIIFENGRVHTADCGIGERERKIIDDFFIKLGTTERQGEINRAELCITLLKERHKHLAEENAQKAKLYRILGVSAGIFGSIIFI